MTHWAKIIYRANVVVMFCPLVLAVSTTQKYIRGRPPPLLRFENRCDAEVAWVNIIPAAQLRFRPQSIFSFLHLTDVFLFTCWALWAVGFGGTGGGTLLCFTWRWWLVSKGPGAMGGHATRFASVNSISNFAIYLFRLLFFYYLIHVMPNMDDGRSQAMTKQAAAATPCSTCYARIR